LKAGFHSTALSIYQGGAAQRQGVGRQSSYSCALEDSQLRQFNSCYNANQTHLTLER
jgi:hypothetical protein